mgnify:CR=1 FL=1
MTPHTPPPPILAEIEHLFDTRQRLEQVVEEMVYFYAQPGVPKHLGNDPYASVLATVQRVLSDLRAA